MQYFAPRRTGTWTFLVMGAVRLILVVAAFLWALVMGPVCYHADQEAVWFDNPKGKEVSPME